MFVTWPFTNSVLATGLNEPHTQVGESDDCQGVGWRSGTTADGCGVPFWDDENVLELGNGDGWIVVNNPEEKLLELYILRW